MVMSTDVIENCDKNTRTYSFYIKNTTIRNAATSNLQLIDLYAEVRKDVRPTSVSLIYSVTKILPNNNLIFNQVKCNLSHNHESVTHKIETCSKYPFHLDLYSLKVPQRT